VHFEHHRDGETIVASHRRGFTRLEEIMNITEILITGYDGDSEVFATNVTGDSAKTAFTAATSGGESIVESVRETTTNALGPLVRVLEDLGLVRRSEPASASK
jgi:hypothetical protein